MSDTNGGNHHPPSPLSPQPSSVRSDNGCVKKHSIDDIIDHMTADLHSYEGQYIVLGAPQSTQNIWTEYSEAVNNPINNRSAQPQQSAGTPVQVIGNRPIFLQQSPTVGYEMRDKNSDFQPQQCGNLFYANPSTRSHTENPNQPGSSNESMISMVNIGGGNYVVLNRGNQQNQHNQIHPQYVTNPGIPMSHHQNIDPDPNIGYVYPQQQPMVSPTQMRDYGLFNQDSTPNINRPSRQLIENLVGNWLPNQSGTYSPFGCATVNRPPNADNNIGVHLNNTKSSHNISSSNPSTLNNNSTRRPRAVAEVRPMRPTYSDVLTKSPPSVSNITKVSSTAPSNNNPPSGNSTPKSENRKFASKNNKSGGNKENGGSSKNTPPTVKKQHLIGAEDLNQKENRYTSNKWMSIEELTPPHSGSEHSGCGDNNNLDGNIIYENGPDRKQTAERKHKKSSTKKKVNEERADSLDSDDKELGDDYASIRSKSSGNARKSYQMNSKLARNRTNADKNASKTKKGPNKEESRYGLGSSSSMKRSQRSGRRKNGQNYLSLILEKWKRYTLIFILWYFNLVWEVLALSYRLTVHLIEVSYEHTVSMINCCKAYVRGMFGQKPSTGPNGRYKSGQHWEPNSCRFKRSWWKFWDRKPPGPILLENTQPTGLTNNMTIPTTGDKAIRRLLSCKDKDPYSILGLTHQCTDDEIKKYYKRQAVLVHPDKNSEPGAEEAFKILAHAFALIGEPEKRSKYDDCIAETHQMEKARTELNDLMNRLHEKMEIHVNSLRCNTCGKRHDKIFVPEKPPYACRVCAKCNVNHSAREGDVWAETSCYGLKWTYFTLLEGKVYDVTKWANCHASCLRNLKPNSHLTKYKIIVTNKPQEEQQNNTPSPGHQRKFEPDLQDFLNNLCSGSSSGGANMGSGDNYSKYRPRRTKKKK